MNISRRTALGVLAVAAPALRLARAKSSPETLDIAPGPFKGTRESLRDYRIPDWYRDAKFGIWAHWGPQSSAEFGDWYARGMYQARLAANTSTTSPPTAIPPSSATRIWRSPGKARTSTPSTS